MSNTTNLESNYQRQIDLEHKMIGLGIDQYRKQLQKAVKKDVQASTDAGKRLLKGHLGRFAEALDRFKDNGHSSKAGRRPASFRYLEQLETETIAYITLQSIINSITKRQTLQNASTAIAGKLEDELRFRHFFANNPDYFQSVYERIKVKNSYDYKRTVLVHSMGKIGIDWEPWTLADKVQIGTTCINLLIESTGLVDLVKIPAAKNNTIYHVCATETTLAWLQEEHERFEVLSPTYLPTLIPPRDWTNPFDGGYHSELADRLRLVRTYNDPYLQELASVEMPTVYRAVNLMQRTAWTINKPVLEVLQSLWRGTSDIAGLPSRDDQLPPPCPFPKELKSKNMTPAQKEVFLDWKRSAAHLWDKNIKDRSKRLMVEIILKVASDFSGEPEIFFPYFLDFRGRAYTVPSFLTPQGSDMAKALLTFAHGKPIADQKAADWLAVHGANLYGYDKVSLSERVQWVKDHEPEILAVADDPLGNHFWTLADDGDKCWQFLAFCFEWAGFVREGFGYVSRLPIALDGSCNGLQHFSAMLRDDIGGEAVNLIPSDTPQDIYQRVADVATEKLKAYIGDDMDLAQGWLSLGIDRDITKRPVMILPYGGTRHACRKYIEEELRKMLRNGKQNPFQAGDEDRIFKASDFLAGIVWESISEVVISAKAVMAWLRKAASLAAKEGLPVNWTSPSGFPIQQAYREFRSRRITTKLSGNLLKSNYRQHLRLTLVEPTDTIDKRKQANGISPNFVHSMDAACLHLYVCRANDLGIEHFSLVHDSYGTLAADTELSVQCIRDVFVEMYRDDVLSIFRTEILEQLSPDSARKLPDIPPQGKLDLEAVKKSAFFFA